MERSEGILDEIIILEVKYSLNELEVAGEELSRTRWDGTRNGGSGKLESGLKL